MELNVPIGEAVAVLRATDALPKAVTNVTGRGSTVLASVNVHQLPDVAPMIRTAAGLAGPFEAQLDDRGVSGRTWRLELRVAHPVLRLDVSGFVTAAVQAQLAKGPSGVATARTETGVTVIEVDLDRVAGLLPGMLPAVKGLQPTVEAISVGDRFHLVAGLTG
jgi:hypothetical protein